MLFRSENYSVFYAWMLPFLLAGLISALKKRTLGEKLLLAWIIFAPLPAALTTDPFHTYRSLLLYLPLSILVACGVSKLWTRYYWILAGVSFVSVSFFLFNYFVINPVVRAKDWDYGYKEMVSFINSQSDYQKVVIDDPWTEPYIHFLFFGKDRKSVV